MKRLKKVLSVFIAALIVSAFSVTACAQEILPFSSDGKIIAVAHGGDTMKYPKNSLAAVQAAFEAGADCVSIDIKRTVDGGFVLSDSNELGDVSLEGRGMVISMLPLSQVVSLHLTDKSANISEYFIADLPSVLKCAVDNDKTLIIDGGWQYREELYNLIYSSGAQNNAIIRTKAPKKEIKAFIAATSSMCSVVGEYHGNILFNARSYISSLSKAGCKMVYLGTKNTFGSIFRKGVISAFSKTSYSSRAGMKTYDMNESGNRPDCEETWGDIIDRGYSVIETDRISDLVGYLNKLDAERGALGALVSQADKVEMGFLTAQSRKEIEKAKKDAAYTMTSLASFETLSLAKSKLNLAINNKVLSDATESVLPGVFRITGGKVIAVLLIAALLAVVQMYFYYMRADRKMPLWLRKFLRK